MPQQPITHWVLKSLSHYVTEVFSWCFRGLFVFLVYSGFWRKAGQGGHAARVLREERNKLVAALRSSISTRFSIGVFVWIFVLLFSHEAHRIATSPARNRKPYEPMSALTPRCERQENRSHGSWCTNFFWVFEFVETSDWFNAFVTGKHGQPKTWFPSAAWYILKRFLFDRSNCPTDACRGNYLDHRFVIGLLKQMRSMGRLHLTTRQTWTWTHIAFCLRLAWNNSHSYWPSAYSGKITRFHQI